MSVSSSSIEPMAHPRFWTPSEIEAVRRLSGEGATLYRMSQESGRTPNAIRIKCRQENIAFRDAHEERKKQPRVWTPEALDELRNIVAEHPADVAAERFGLSVAGIRSVMTKHGIRGRGVRRPRTAAERAAMSAGIRRLWNVKYPPEGPWTCTVCGVEKPISEFPKATSQHMCRECRRVYHIAKTYGITMEQYRELLAAQDGVCAICQSGEVKRHHETGVPFMLCVDHDHNCCPGKRSCGECVRGLLCSRCNSVLGHVELNGLMEGMAGYLERHAG